MTSFRNLSICLLFVMALACGGGAEAPSVTEISHETLLTDPPSDVLILDVRTSGEFEAGHVPNALNIPHDQLASRLLEIDGETDRPIVVYCKSGRRARMASSILVDAGHTNVAHLVGHMDAWDEKGLPTE
jgi:phage shock protein E